MLSIPKAVLPVIAVAITCCCGYHWWFNDEYLYELKENSPCAIDARTLDKAWQLNEQDRMADVVDLVYAKKVYELDVGSKVHTLDIRGEYVRVRIKTGYFTSTECWVAKRTIQPK